jgi:putative endonuclease
MTAHLNFGKKGEDMAVEWLQSNGYEILHRNWRHSYFEIDIIAKKNKVLHIIEVKSRHYGPIGFPENNVGRKKFRSLQRAADQFLFMNPGHKWVQYDILAITAFRDKEPEYFLLEDVFF